MKLTSRLLKKIIKEEVLQKKQEAQSPLQSTHAETPETQEVFGLSGEQIASIVEEEVSAVMAERKKNG
tara:strand:- start:240 stop:443 length:204 start_codon:yes stop_codon:yes gene_type:complete